MRKRCRSDIANSRVSHGFTLIEVSIVIFIILLMTSAVVPWMRTFNETTKLRTASRSIRSLMEFARESAISERKEYVVLFDASNGEYWLSLLELLEGTSGGSITDSSRTSSASKSSSKTESESEEVVEGAYTRTGGILGVPKQLPSGVQIAQIVSTHNSSTFTSGSGDIEYITFYPDSTAEDFEIYLQGTSGRTFLVSVAEATGRAGIRELNAEEMDKLGLSTESQ